jgi:predicted metal-dependent phosphoesterase TrpH
VLIEKGYFSEISDVFKELIGVGKSAYVERFKVSVKEGIDIIIKAGGIPILAHPRLIKNYGELSEIDDFIRNLIEFGLSGIEVYHSMQSDDYSQKLYDIAKKYNLVMTGGSDCHGKMENGRLLLGTKGIMYNDFIKIIRSYYGSRVTKP